MYSNNNSMSYEDKNEFMPSFQKVADQHFQSFMQKCIQNPDFYSSMKEIFDKNQANNSKINSHHFNNEQSFNQKNPWISSEYSSFEPIPEQSNKSKQSHSQRFQHEGNDKHAIKMQEKRLPSNPLLKYQLQEQQEQKQKITEKRKQARVNFDDIPIRPKQVQLPSSNRASFDLNSIKQNQSVNIDNIQRPTKARNTKDPYKEAQERPIKSMAPQQFEKNYQPPVENSRRPNYEDDQQDQQFQFKKTAPAISKQRQQKKIQNFEDKPISGMKKSFKQSLKEQFADQFPEQQIDQEENLQDKKTVSRNFLKRGSRQHLSSAMNRSKQPKKEQDLNKSGLGKDRELTPKNTKNQNRSVSANRVLGKKPKQNLDRSINKGVAKKTLQQSQMEDDNMNSRAIKKPPLAKDKGKKIQIQAVTHTNNNSKVSPLASKKKTKNVFQDNSSSSSSQEEPYFKAVQQKPNNQNLNQGKIQVLDNIYLTQEQLDEIVSKYGKPAKIIPKQTESQKLQAIRNKYKELCHIAAMQRQAFQDEMKSKNQEFQKYKEEQIIKIKNEKRIMERQLKSGSSNQALLREKEQLENLKSQLERQKEEFKKKDKNNKIMLEKYKKENEELKSKIERLQSQKQSLTSKKYLNSYKSDQFQTQEKSSTKVPINNNKNKKVQEQPIKQQISYKNIQKSKDTIKQIVKPKYQYAQQEPIAKNKITNVVKQVKIQNKRLSNNFVQESSSDQHSLQEQQQQQHYSQPESNMVTKLSDLSKMDLSIKMVTDKMISSLFKFQNNADYKKYMQAKLSPSRTIVNTTRNAKNAYVANLYSDRSKQLIYDNGTRKQTFENGFNIVYFKNGDIKQTLPDKNVLYFFKQKEVDQITLTNGVNIYRFENNQVEFHFPNGGIEIRHADGTIKVLGDHTRR